MATLIQRNGNPNVNRPLPEIPKDIELENKFNFLSKNRDEKCDVNNNNITFANTRVSNKNNILIDKNIICIHNQESDYAQPFDSLNIDYDYAYSKPYRNLDANTGEYESLNRETMETCNDHLYEEIEPYKKIEDTALNIDDNQINQYETLFQYEKNDEEIENNIYDTFGDEKNRLKK